MIQRQWAQMPSVVASKVQKGHKGQAGATTAIKKGHTEEQCWIKDPSLRPQQGKGHDPSNQPPNTAKGKGKGNAKGKGKSKSKTNSITEEEGATGPQQVPGGAEDWAASLPASSTGVGSIKLLQQAGDGGPVMSFNCPPPSWICTLHRWKGTAS